MKPISCNQRNRGQRKAFVSRRPTGPCLVSAPTIFWMQEEYEPHLIFQSFHTRDNVDTLVSNTRQ